MAQDDMFVVMYKILAYLYDCLKRGVEPSRTMLAHDGDMLAIDYGYWTRIMYELDRHGYVDGFVVKKVQPPAIIVNMVSPTITMEGVEFLKENSRMQKALRFLKETKSALPFL
ncbi:MAG: hypothetical protein IJ087_14760 [Eggerthellaceae bacterium]|nr:hypothetical protein [Eggerthellaceae bacterium]